ncbi:sigma-70 family RNA polymerase sigma factor [Acrocarpospora phusangensis]|nr:sigma-70 family RNA polymerase sigma factor [Acrocarpospora phusangensis]
MDDAIAGHSSIVDEQARRLCSRNDADWDDVTSDGMLALWRALAAYDPALRDLHGYLRLRVRHRMIDGMRRRSGRGQDLPALISLDDNADLVPPENPDLGARVDLTDTVLRLAPLDPRLPAIAALLVAGYTKTETGALQGLSRGRVWQLLSLAQRSGVAA